MERMLSEWSGIKKLAVMTSEKIIIIRVAEKYFIIQSNSDTMNVIIIEIVSLFAQLDSAAILYTRFLVITITHQINSTTSNLSL